MSTPQPTAWPVCAQCDRPCIHTRAADGIEWVWKRNCRHHRAPITLAGDVANAPPVFTVVR